MTLCVDPDWIPFESINESGEYEGIAADLIKLISERTGITFILVPTKTWGESIALSKDGKCQALSFLNETPSRKEWLSFSDPIFTDVNVFITREEHHYISDPGGLVGETLVLPKGTSIEEMVKDTYPNLHVITVESEADALKMVSERKADMTLRSLIVAAYTIKKEGWFNLKISGQLPGYENKLRIGLRKEKEPLLGIINRGIKSITGQDRGVIVNRHVSINIQSITDYSLLYKVSGGFLGILMIASAWVWQLRRHNRELAKISQTDTLTGLANRTRLNDVLSSEYKRSGRNLRPLSVLLVDVDHFKRVNDDLGHLVGDMVLKELGSILRSSVRDMDVVGRWGGEEFLIICPETDTDNAAKVAGRIVSTVADAPFSSQRQQTVSVGVASLAENDSTDALLSRADTALYSAKKSGRNRYRH
ncbi:diguanylate cyclase [Fundidesulfovibrio butyratiphilus]